MIKNVVYPGLVLLVIGFVAFFALSHYITIGNSVSAINTTALQGEMSYVPISLNNSAIGVVGVAADADTNIYLLNQTTLNGLVSYLNANSLRSGYSYVTEAGVNSNDISLNNSYWFVSVYPTLQNATTENYTDYVVIDNTAGSPSTNGTVEASVVYKSYNYASGIKGSSIFLAPVLVIILGFALIIYGLVKKPPEVKEEPQKPNKDKKKRRS